MKFNAAVALALILTLMMPAGASAMNAGMGTDLLTIEDSPIPLTIRGSTEYLWGESHEYVYDTVTGDKVSQLDWDLENIVMVGGTISARFTDWMQLNFGGWSAVNEGDGHMVDKDWNPALSSDWDSWSKSRCRLDHGYMIDANLAFPLEVNEWFTVSPMAGFKFDNWKWHDRGGEYIYSSAGGFRDLTGSFGNDVGIRYEQWFYAPYLGLNLSAKYEGFFANAYFKGSPWAWSEDKDQHLMRDLEFKDKVYNQGFIGAGVEVGYDVLDWFYLMVGYDYQEFMNNKGDTDISSTVTGDSATSSKGAGISHHSSAVSFSFGFKF